MATATTEPERLPPGPRIPRTIQGIAFLIALCEVAPALGRRYGSPYTINLPIFGRTVVVSDAALAKEIFAASSELVELVEEAGPRDLTGFVREPYPPGIRCAAQAQSRASGGGCIGR